MSNTKSHKPQIRLSIECLQRTLSDISFELSKEANDNIVNSKQPQQQPSTLSETIEDAKCECCDMLEECTKEYIAIIRKKYFGKLICGLCAEAVNSEIEKRSSSLKEGILVKSSATTREEALNEHMSACVKFNRLGRTHPLLYQAEAIKEILKKSSSRRTRAKSMSPRDYNNKSCGETNVKSGLTRTSSCIPEIARDI